MPCSMAKKRKRKNNNKNKERKKRNSSFIGLKYDLTTLEETTAICPPEQPLSTSALAKTGRGQGVTFKRMTAIEDTT